MLLANSRLCLKIENLDSVILSLVPVSYSDAVFLGMKLRELNNALKALENIFDLLKSLAYG